MANVFKNKIYQAQEKNKKDKKYPTNTKNVFTNKINANKRAIEEKRWSENYKLQYISSGKSTGGSTKKLKQDYYNSTTKISDFSRDSDIHPYYKTGNVFKDRINKNEYLIKKGYWDDDYTEKYLKRGQSTGGNTRILSGEWTPKKTGQERKKEDLAKYEATKPKFDKSGFGDIANAGKRFFSALNPFDGNDFLEDASQGIKHFQQGVDKTVGATLNKLPKQILKPMTILGTAPESFLRGVAESSDKNVKQEKDFFKQIASSTKNIPKMIGDGVKNVINSSKNIMNDKESLGFEQYEREKVEKHIKDNNIKGQEAKKLRQGALVRGVGADVVSGVATAKTVGDVGLGDILRGSGKATDVFADATKKSKLNKLGQKVDAKEYKSIRTTVNKEVNKLNKNGFKIEKSNVDRIANNISNEIDTFRKSRVSANQKVGNKVAQSISDKTIAPIVNRLMYEVGDKLNLKGYRDFNYSTNTNQFAKTHIGKKISGRELDTKTRFDKTLTQASVEDLKRVKDITLDEAEILYNTLTGKISKENLEYLTKAIEKVRGRSIVNGDEILDEVSTTTNRRYRKGVRRTVEDVTSKLEQELNIKSSKLDDATQLTKIDDISTELSKGVNPFDDVKGVIEPFKKYDNSFDDYFMNLKNYIDNNDSMDIKQTREFMKKKNRLLNDIQKYEHLIPDEIKPHYEKMLSERKGLFQINSRNKTRRTAINNKQLRMDKNRYTKLTYLEDDVLDAIYNSMKDKKLKQNAIEKLTTEKTKKVAGMLKAEIRQLPNKEGYKITDDMLHNAYAKNSDIFKFDSTNRLINTETGEIFSTKDRISKSSYDELREYATKGDIQAETEKILRERNIDINNVSDEFVLAVNTTLTELQDMINKEVKHGILSPSTKANIGNEIGRVLFKNKINDDDLVRLKKHFITDKYAFGTKKNAYGRIDDLSFRESLDELFNDPKLVTEKLTELITNRYKISDESIYDKLATENFMNVVGYSANIAKAPKNTKPYISIGELRNNIDEMANAMKDKIVNKDMTKQEVYDAMNDFKRRYTKDQFGLDWDKDLDELGTPLLDLTVKGREHLIEAFKKDSTLNMKYIDKDAVKHWNLERDRQIKQNSNQILKIYDKYLTDFKTTVTAYNPLWHTKNFIQNYLQGFIEEGIAILNPKNRQISIKIANEIMGDTTYLGKTFKRNKLGNKIDGTFKDANGRVFKVSELLEKIEKEGLVESGLFGTELDAKAYKGLKGTGTKAKAFFEDVVRASGENSMWSLGGLHNKSRQEAFSRVQVVLAGLDNGKTIEEAIKSSKKSLFDYNDLNMFEYNTMKRLVPFYAFMSKNIPYQLENMLNQPIKYMNMYKVLDGVGEYSELGSDYINQDSDNYRWTENRIRLPFEKTVTVKSKKGKEYEQRIAMFIDNLTPHPNRLFPEVMSDLTPPLKAINQLGNDKDFFGDKIHGGDKGKGIEYFFNEVSPIQKRDNLYLNRSANNYIDKNKKAQKYNENLVKWNLLNPVTPKYYRVHK